MSQPVIGLPFSFLDELVLRTPALPFVPLLDGSKADALIYDQDFMEAVYLASPVLYAECSRLVKGELTDAKEVRKVKTSLIKYYQRMYSRCTPFGLFSGCSLTKWGDEQSHITIPADKFFRSTRLDMHYLCALGQHLSSLPGIKERLLYFPNNSAYRIGNEVRYIEYRYQKGRRVHQISSVFHSEYLDAVFTRAGTGARIGEIMDLLVEQQEVSGEEAMDFIDEMISSQVLISEMDPAITGEEFIHQLLTILGKINVDKNPAITVIHGKLEHILASLKEIDDRVHNSPETYISLIESIKELNVPFEEGKLLQVDAFSEPLPNSIKSEWKNDLFSAFGLLAKLFSSAVNENLNSFAERFRKRYEDQQVPLLKVLDAETGIGYTERGGTNLSPLVENLVLPGRNSGDSIDIKWNKTEQWLFDKLIKHPDASEVVVEENELKDFTADFSNFPPSMSVMFTVLDNGKLLFKGCSGSSAANLLGRFAHADKNICELVKRITKQEQQLNDEVIFAEIVHLPEDRVGNILLHPAFREYEIPFLAQSSLPPDNRVMLQDIMISVQQDKRIRLFSRKLNKEIIPRLSSAHNYSFASLPVYYFLAELQMQGLVSGLAFNWGTMARHFRYLPRASFGNVILFEATWQLRKEDFEKLLNAQQRLNKFQEQWKLPRYVVLADGDNELLVDLESNESVETFTRTIKDREFITLKEFLKPCSKTVTNEKQSPYNNQFIAVLMNDQQVYTGSQPFINEDQQTNTQRNFLPGSEWLYYKIYCGTKTADEVLIAAILPLTERLLQLKLVDKWFFIRYNDPDFHLRIRFHLPDTRSLGEVMNLVLQHLEELEKEGLVSRILTDTYKREIERYGNTLTEAAEELFFTDSKMKLQFLSLTEGDEREKLRWLWALRETDEWLNAFDYSIENKYELMRQLQAVFSKEYNADKTLYRQLNQQYSDNRKQILMALESPPGEVNIFTPLLTIINEYKDELRVVSQRIIADGGLSGNYTALNSLLSSYIHMNLNRLFLSEPRLHELVIYDMLCSYYRSVTKRQPPK